jgi:chemotaxis response regulator CheB
LALKEGGAYTIAQDEATSAVYGMPKVAFELGAVREVQPAIMIAAAITRQLC